MKVSMSRARKPLVDSKATSTGFGRHMGRYIVVSISAPTRLDGKTLTIEFSLDEVDKLASRAAKARWTYEPEEEKAAVGDRLDILRNRLALNQLFHTPANKAELDEWIDTFCAGKPAVTTALIVGMNYVTKQVLDFLNAEGDDAKV